MVANQKIFRLLRNHVKKGRCFNNELNNTQCNANLKKLFIFYTGKNIEIWMNELNMYSPRKHDQLLALCEINLGIIFQIKS